jgi:Tol biopolymer transport system component
MSSDRRFEQDLPALLDDLYMGPVPTYRDDILEQAARTRQRSAWSILERWLPMVDLARQPVLVRRLPWRAIGLGFVLLVLLVALVAALAVGGRPKLPQPFGPARNGLVAYASGGDIYTVDPITGDSTAIVSGPEPAFNPRYSRDGTRFAFERTANVDARAGLLYVARADGSDLIQVTPQPLVGIDTYAFSPNGKEILITASPSGIPSLFIAAADGSGIRQLDLPGRVTDAAWRPPDGSEILFMDSSEDPNGVDSGIYAVNAQDGKVRTIVANADAAGRFRGHPMWSPDGSLISFGEWLGVNGIDVRTHIIAADGTADRILPIPTGAVWQAPYSWSNDGTRLLAIRGYTGGAEQARPVAIPVDGSGSGIEIPFPGGMGTPSTSAWEWAPDDSSILGTPASVSGALLAQVLLDPVAGTSRTLPWQSVSQPSWQRLAP